MADFLLPLFFVLVCSIVSAEFQTFDEWAQFHGKTYADDHERAQRMKIYQTNSIRARELNQRGTAKFNLNKFADLSSTEFRFQRAGYKPQTTHVPRDGGSSAVKPNVTSVNWRTKNAVSKVYNQDQCGCCWAISVTETIESHRFIHGLGPLESLSWQQLICCDCKTDDQGCNGGDPNLAYRYIIGAGGLESLKEYPFTDGGPPMPWEDRCNTDMKKSRCNGCKFSKAKVVATITGYKNVTSGDEAALADAVATQGPISICIDSEPWQLYDGGIMSKCARKLDHCVQVVGYDAAHDPPYWIVKNSWGSDWGEKGYIRLKMGSDVCGVADVPTYPTFD